MHDSGLNIMKKKNRFDKEYVVVDVSSKRAGVDERAMVDGDVEDVFSHSNVVVAASVNDSDKAHIYVLETGVVSKTL